ncbi:winged helix-turn-helix transcriptional regulator [Agrobacterium sp. OT33]|uniref:helix-turn-helix transcriptional regulator n=1 Tax=Agrobacterium sp. OT33 TaxID=2815338 RepID=UPI001A8DE076|nr:winged helix-turn-helix transcriptional regulator [Agrobacterium sp. OT33]
MTKPFVFVFSGVFSVKSRSSFDELMRRLTDTWLENAGKLIGAETLCRSVQGILGINMVLVTVDMQAKVPMDWRLDFISKYMIPTSLLDGEKLQQTQAVRDFPDITAIIDTVTKAFETAAFGGRPSIGKVDQRIRNVRVIGDYIILPDPMGAWCVALAEIHSLSAIGRNIRYDDTDLSIIQLLREGLSARDIAQRIELSPRTIEHRIERMKKRAGVKGTPSLLFMNM